MLQRSQFVRLRGLKWVYYADCLTFGNQNEDIVNDKRIENKGNGAASLSAILKSERESDLAHAASR